MKKTIFRCLVCSEEFESLDEAEYHLEHSDSNHDYMREKLGIPTLIQAYTFDTEDVPEKEDDSQTTLQDLRKLKELPQVFTDKAVQYPYPPYYRYEYYGKEHYLCAEHNIEVADPKEFLRHLTEIQTHKEDIEPWLLNHTKRVIHNRIRHEKGSSMRLSDEDLDRYAETEIKELMFGLELQAPQPERMAGIVSSKYANLKAFLAGKLDHCPECNLASMNLSATDKEAYREKLILDGIKKVNPHLSSIKYDPKNPQGYYEHLTHQKFQGTWNSEPISLCLLCNMHAHLRHPLAYKQLWSSNILGGQLPDYLASESYLSGKKPLRAEMNLSKVDMLKWLKGDSK